MSKPAKIHAKHFHGASCRFLGIALAGSAALALSLSSVDAQTEVAAPTLAAIPTSAGIPIPATTGAIPVGPPPSPAHAAPPVLSAGDMAIAQQAFTQADAGLWPQAETLAATASDPLVPRLIQWRDFQRANAGHGFAEIAAFIEANPDWPHQALLRMRAEDTLADVPDDRLRAWFASHKPVTGFAKLRAAELQGEAKVPAAAAPAATPAAAGAATATAPVVDPAAQAEIRRIWIATDFTPVEEKVVLARYGVLFTQADDEKRLDRLLWDGRYEEAQRELPRVGPDWHALAVARLMLATQARSADKALAKVPPTLADDPGLRYERMRAALRRNQIDEAAALIEGAAVLGRPEAWWPSRQSLARALLTAGQADRAYRVIAAHGMTEGNAVAEAEFTSGWIALRFLKNPQDAYAHFTHLYQSGKLPLTLSRGAYWAGRAAEALGRADEAQSWYGKAAGFTTTYYGQLAAAKPGVLPPDKPVPEPQASAREHAAFDKLDLVRATRLLAALDEPDSVRAFLIALTERAESPSDHALVADLAEEIGRPDLGVAAARRAARDGVSLLRAGYPIVPMPRNAGTEQALLLAITRQESSFDNRAVSPTGARGLMQLMPGTASQMAKVTDTAYAPSQLNDPFYNVTLGQAYMDTLVAQFNGSYVLAIAAYNAGPGRVRQWLAQFGDPRSPEVDAVDWVEEIPFTETRNYVQRVLENLQVYRLRIGDRALAFSLDADLRR